MKQLSLMTLMFFVSQIIFGQWLPEGYELNGAISTMEYRDTAHFKPVYQDGNLLIKESKDAYYVAIQSNGMTIGNVYYLGETQLKVMHVSAAAGETNYDWVDQQWKKDRQKWDWRHRDTQYWKELHASPLQDLKAFYQTFHWVGTTVSKGSYRELEFLLSKELVKDFERLRVSYLKRTTEGGKLITGPGEDKGILTDEEMNMKIHMGDMPEVLEWEN